MNGKPPENRNSKILLEQNSIQGKFNWPDLQKIQNPIWLCSGEADLQPTEQSKKFNEVNPKSIVKVIPQCGHIPWIDEPELFYTELENFIRGPL